jgi:hypothetical protein
MPTHVKSPSKSSSRKDVDLLIHGRGDALKQILGRIDGLSIDENFQGTLDLGDTQADIYFEPPDCIRICSSPVLPMYPDDALRRNHWLAGNLRYAGNRNGMKLLADTQINGMSCLAECLEEIRRGMRALLDGKKSDQFISNYGGKPLAEAGEIDRDRFKEALNTLPFGEDSIVQRAGDSGYRAWEIRPRLEGEAVPVLVDYMSGGVRIHRTLLDAVPPAGRQAAADQALRLNGQIRFCRFALAGDELVVETLLNAGLIETSRLTTAALAVATAGSWAKDVLDALARNERAASLYQAVFCNHKVENNFA